MNPPTLDRRRFLQTLTAGFAVSMLDWDALPCGKGGAPDGTTFDAVIIGSGLGGLSCAAAFARRGFHPLVIEQHDKPGGYATSFSRPGGYEFDVSLHATTVGERNGIRNLIPGFPEITDVEFIPHPHLYRLMLPDHDLRVPQRNIAAYEEDLCRRFPAEREGIHGLLQDMRGLAEDIGRLIQAQGNIVWEEFPVKFPLLARYYNRPWGAMVDARIHDPKVRMIVSALWGYYGLPPSKLAATYYALPTYDYLVQGGHYAKGRSQAISNAFVRFIESHGGKVLLNTRVDRILTKDGAACGVRTSGGDVYTARVVVSNANALDTFHRLLDPSLLTPTFLDSLDHLKVSLSGFQIYLGLSKDLVREHGITDSEIFLETGYDPDASYADALAARVENGSCSVTFYDVLDPAYSPAGKNTLTIMTLQGFDHWKQYEDAYLKGEKKAYKAEKERMAKVLIEAVEHRLLPGLSDAISVCEIGTPLTNRRYTGNSRGALYGWDQTVDNSGRDRFPHATPVKQLYLSGAWTSPGHGYGGVIASGVECFGEIMRHW